MFRPHFYIALLSLVLVMAGCTPTVMLSEYPEDTTSTMEQAARMPDKRMLEASQERTRVILLDADQTDGSKGNRELTEAFSREVEALLVKKGVEIVDRTLANKLDQEIKACEMQGRSKCVSGVQPTMAQYAVKPSVTNATYSATPVNAQTATGGDKLALMMSATYGSEFVQRYAVDGVNDQIIVKPHMLHNAKVSTTVKVFEIPSLREVKAVVGSGTQTQRTAERAQVGNAMLVNALSTAVPSGENLAELANVFAPKGYIIGRRSNAKASIFRISMGSGQGVQPGVPVVIAREQENENPISGQKTIDLIDVVVGKVSDQVMPNESWVVPDDEDKAKKVNLGDRVLVRHSAGWLGRVNSSLQKFAQ